MKRPITKEVREARRKSAEARNAAWQAKAPKQQLAELDRRLGAGVGAKKQRARIAKRPK